MSQGHGVVADDGQTEPVRGAADHAAQLLLDFLRKAVDASLTKVPLLGHDSTQALHLRLLGLYGTILELADTIDCLLRMDKPTGVPTLLRSAFEAYVDLVNLSVDPKYGYRLDVADTENWLRLLRAAKAGDNPFLKAFAEHPLLGQWIGEHEAKRARLVSTGYRKADIAEKVRIAGMEHFYPSVYNRLCSHSHNNLDALHCRHFGITPGANRVQVEYFAPAPVGQAATSIAHMVAIVMDSSIRMHTILKPGDLPYFEGLTREHRVLVANLPTAVGVPQEVGSTGAPPHGAAAQGGRGS